MADVQRDIANVMYSNLADFSIQMPTNFVGGGQGDGGKLPTNLDILTTFGALDYMQQIKGDAAQSAGKPGPRAE
jgi:hypothetical protein